MGSMDDATEGLALADKPPVAPVASDTAGSSRDRYRRRTHERARNTWRSAWRKTVSARRFPWAQVDCRHRRVGERKRTKNPANAAKHAVLAGKNRRRRDSNPRDPFEPNGFQDRRLQPLGHSSECLFRAGTGALDPRQSPRPTGIFRRCVTTIAGCLPWNSTVPRRGFRRNKAPG